MYEIILYENVHGISPVHHFISELDQKSKRSKDAKIQLKQIMFQLDLLSELGTRCQSEYVKYIRNNIWELRPGDNRILFFSWENNKIVLLHSFRKKPTKLPLGKLNRLNMKLRIGLTDMGSRGDLFPLNISINCETYNILI